MCLDQCADRVHSGNASSSGNATSEASSEACASLYGGEDHAASEQRRHLGVKISHVRNAYTTSFESLAYVSHMEAMLRNDSLADRTLFLQGEACEVPTRSHDDCTHTLCRRLHTHKQ